MPTSSLQQPTFAAILRRIEWRSGGVNQPASTGGPNSSRPEIERKCGFAKGMTSLEATCSPDPRQLAPIGELLGTKTAKKPGDLPKESGFIRHGCQTPGEEFAVRQDQARSA